MSTKLLINHEISTILLYSFSLLESVVPLFDKFYLLGKSGNPRM